MNKQQQRKPFPGKKEKSEPEFYQLEKYDDQKSMCAHLAVHFKAQGVIIRCDILKVQYIPLRKFQVLYRLQCEKEEVRTSILLVRFFQPGQSAKRYKKAVAAAINKMAVLHLQDLDAVAWIFPEDPKFPKLRKIFNDEGQFNSQLRKPDSISFAPDIVDLEILSYHPGNRCALKAKGLASNKYFICKIQDSQLTAEADSHLLDLWQSAKRRFKMPKPVGCNITLGIRWESFEEGKTIEENYSILSFRSLIRDITYDLLNLHQIPIENLNHIGSQEQIISQIENTTLPRLLTALPFHRQKLNALYGQLIRKATTLPEPSIATIHGDLHTANILIGPEGLVFIDMDSLAIGDPVYDLAYFGSRLLLNALSRKERLKEAANAMAALPDAYKIAGGVNISHRTFAWYLSAFLLSREIKSCVLHQVSDLERLTEKLLDIADEALKRGRFDSSIGMQ